MTKASGGWELPASIPQCGGDRLWADVVVDRCFLDYLLPGEHGGKTAMAPPLSLAPLVLHNSNKEAQSTNPPQEPNHHPKPGTTSQEQVLQWSQKSQKMAMSCGTILFQYDFLP
jgi:hypothetical protein